MPHIPGHTSINPFENYTPGWWGQVLEGFEPAQYYSSPRGLEFGRRSPSRQRYFENSYQDVLNDYYRTAGTAMRQNQAPASFMDYLETNPWTSRYTSLPQSTRGTTGRASNPRTRFLFNY